MPRKKDTAGACMDAALSLAAISGWNNVTLYDIAAETNLPLTDVVEAMGGRSGILTTLAARADAAMLSAVDEDWGNESIRDRLFALLMARFDYLRDRREGVRAVLAGLPGDPMTALQAAAGPGLKSMKLALEAAGVSASGLGGAVRARALGLAYAAVVRIFLDDDSEDLSKTMAALDRRLARLQNLAERFPLNRPVFRRPMEETASDTLEDQSPL